MSLIHCPECGHEVSSTAVSCPNCARPIVPFVERIEPVVERGMAPAAAHRRETTRGWRSGHGAMHASAQAARVARAVAAGRHGAQPQRPRAPRRASRAPRAARARAPRRCPRTARHRARRSSAQRTSSSSEAGRFVSSNISGSSVVSSSRDATRPIAT